MKTSHSTFNLFWGKMTLASIKLVSLAFLLFCFSSVLSAQVVLPDIKNKATGKVIALRKAAVVIAPAGPTPVATKIFPVAGGGSRTVRLFKGNTNVAFAPTNGATASTTYPDKICTTRPVNGERGGIDASNLNPATQAIYPGSIIDGLTVPTGEYRQITALRNPIVVSLSSNANGISAAQSVDQPNVATIRTAVDRMLGHKTTAFVPEERDDRTIMVRSKEEVMLALNVHASGLFISNFDAASTFSENADEMTFVRILKDRYFSVDMVPPAEDKDFFENEATNILPGWTYVSSMKYGRMAMLIITVKTKEREITASLRAEYKAIFSAGGSFSTDMKSKTESVQIQSWNRGGAPISISASNVQGVPAAIQKFNTWVQNGAINPEPLTYTLNFVKYENGGPAVASINSVLSFTERNCRALQPRYEITLKQITCVKDADGGDNRAGEDITGLLEAKAYNSNNAPIHALFGKPIKMWEDKTDCGTSIREQHPLIVPDNTRYYDVDADDRDARINIGGDLDEDDNCGVWNVGDDDEFDDANGARTRKDIFFRNIGTAPQTILFDHRNGNEHVQQVWILKKTMIDR